MKINLKQKVQQNINTRIIKIIKKKSTKHQEKKHKMNHTKKWKKNKI